LAHLSQEGCAFFIASSPGRKAEEQMADATAAPAAEIEQGAQTPTPEQAQPDATGEKAERTFKQSEVEALIRERLASAERKSAESARKAAADAEAKALKEQGEYKTLYEKMQAELEQERTRAKALEVAGMRRDVAARLQLPVGLVDRLRGETMEDIEADAAALLAALPKPSAPNINAGNGSGKGGAGVLSDDELEQKAARLGVSLKYAKQFLNGQGV
jgi:hypothetical protein